MVTNIAKTYLPDAPVADGLPLIGNTMNFVTADGLPIKAMQDAVRKHGDLVHFNVLGHSIYTLGSPELVHEVLVKRSKEFEKPETFSEKPTGLRRFLGKGILTSSLEEWRPQRKLIQPLMHTQHIKSYADTMGQLCEKLLSTWESGTERDIHEDMVNVTIWIIAETVFGLSSDELPDLEDSVEAAQSVGLSDFSSPFPSWLTGRDRTAARVNKLLAEIVEDFKERSRNRDESERIDLLSLLMETRDEEGNLMSDDFIRDNILTLFFAGHETTANTLTWAFYYLSQNPDVAEKLHHELDTVLEGRVPSLDDLPSLPYTAMVVKETMRIQPTVPAIPRKTGVSTELGGYHIEAGSAIFISPYILHHDERYWDNPETFDPERFSAENESSIPKYAYLPFGGGPRICIGNHFAMMEAQIVLATIASQYELTLKEGAVVVPLQQITTSPKYGLPMILEKCN